MSVVPTISRGSDLTEKFRRPDNLYGVSLDGALLSLL
jgi:hypothetical protein